MHCNHVHHFNCISRTISYHHIVDLINIFHRWKVMTHTLFQLKIRVFAFFEILDNNQTFTSYLIPVGQRHDKKRYKYESLYTACYTTIFDHFLFFIISLHFFLLIGMTTAFTSTSNLRICNTLLRNFELVCVCVLWIEDNLFLSNIKA